MIRNNSIKEIGDGILDFLRKNNLEETLPEVIEYLKGKLKSEKIIVRTPRILSTSEKKDLQKLLTKLIGGKLAGIDYIEDKSLVDGFVVNYNDKMWDFSLKSQIGKIAQI